jgi:hypothetical protein
MQVCFARVSRSKATEQYPCPQDQADRNPPRGLLTKASSHPYARILSVFCPVNNQNVGSVGFNVL